MHESATEKKSGHESMRGVLRRTRGEGEWGDDLKWDSKKNGQQRSNGRVFK